MSGVPAERTTVHFGVFQANFHKGELRKHGVRLRMQQQPLRILEELIRHPGELVTREELIASLWPDGRVVDFDHGLNASVTRLRQGLSDSAENPRYIETVAGRGYRFIAPVEGPPKPPPIDLPPAPKPRRVLAWSLAAAGVLLAGAVGGWVAWRPERPLGIVPDTLTRLTSDTGLTTNPALSPDGALLAYASDRAGGGNLEIWVEQTRGGGALRLTYGTFDSDEPSFSPDGRRIAFRSDRDGGGIYVIPALGGEAVRIAPRGLRPRFSPDGRSIVYTVGLVGGLTTGGSFSTPGGVTVYVTPSQGGTPRNVCPTMAWCSFPVWTPDGSHILFLGNRDPNLWNEPPANTPLENVGLDWWVVPQQGGAPVATGAVKQFRAAGFLGLSHPPEAWIPGGEGVVVSAPVGDTRNLWVVPLSPDWKAKAKPYRLSTGTARDRSAVSANGRFAFASATESTNIWGLPVDVNQGRATGAPQRLTTGSAFESYPAVSPDGRRLAFSSNRAGNREIWLKEVGSSGEIAVTNTPTPENYPSFSPDGTKLLYRAIEARRPVYYIRTLPGEATRRLCDGCVELAGWSSDASKILCVKCSAARLGLLEWDTGKTRDLADHPTDALWNPRFSPDDRWVAFNATGPARSRIYVARFPAEGRIPEAAWIPITEEKWADLPRWSPDGNILYFVSERDGFRCIWAQRLNRRSKRPEGPAVAVYHSHQASLSLGNCGIGDLELSVARDKLVFTMGQRTANVWSFLSARQ